MLGFPASARPHLVIQFGPAPLPVPRQLGGVELDVLTTPNKPSDQSSYCNRIFLVIPDVRIF
jgi:hypothetical protein